MDTQIMIIGAVGLAIFGFTAYFLRQKKPTEHPYLDVLNNEEYKVKGQWDK